MDISIYIAEYARKKRYVSSLYDAKTVRNLLVGDGDAALVQQDGYANSEYLAYNIQESVKKYTRNKDVAIHIYKDFLAFLGRKGVNVEVCFPPISVSNTFERLMFIAKYLQDPRHKISSIKDILWVSQRTIEEDIKRLRGDHEDPIQICGKVFQVPDMERNRDAVYFPSTAHPLFLSPNLTQSLVMLKGLKAMSEDPLYAEYARLAAADIWEQLSDYAKTRIHFVLSEVLPEDLAWYESLKKEDEDSFYSEYRCSKGVNIFLDCIKNDKPFFVIYEGENGLQIYTHCTFVNGSMKEQSFEVTCTQGRVRLYFDKIVRSAYTAEELM